jgi:hypothetical protein
MERGEEERGRAMRIRKKDKEREIENVWCIRDYVSSTYPPRPHLPRGLHHTPCLLSASQAEKCERIPSVLSSRIASTHPALRGSGSAVPQR